MNKEVHPDGKGTKMAFGFKHFHADWQTPIEEIKRQYRDLVMKNHPDLGGSNEVMAEINSEWDWFKRHNYNIHESAQGGTYVKEDQTAPDATTENFTQIIEAILRMGVDVEIVGSWLWLDGDTKPHKEEIKSLGFKWSGKRYRWYMAPSSERWHHRGSNESMDGIRARYGSTWLRASDEAISVA